MRPSRPGAMMRKRHAPVSLLAITSLLATTAIATPQLPYTPSQILMPTSCFDSEDCDGAHVGYIFQPDSDSSTIIFSKFGYSKAIDGSNDFEIVTKKLPFLEGGGETRSFAAARGGDGKVRVFAGDCDRVGGGEIWEYSEDNDWEKISSDDDDDGDDDEDGVKGPGFLGAMVAFSGTIAPEMEEARMFTYGGMCPTTSGSGDPQQNITSWQGNANYSKSLVELSTKGKMEVRQMRAPRWPMAGFSMTSLTPSRSNASGTVTQEVGFVVLGGHTERGFINVYDAAVWRLPGEGWEYIHIAQEEDDEEEEEEEEEGSGMELAVKAVAKREEKEEEMEVSPRSGHSAVLSEDGKSIVVLGGWVGDVTNASLPQLAVLEMGQTEDEWRWRVPEEQPEKGIYGHGATMLPGNVMMVVGGWETKGSGKSKRQDGGSDVNFLNLTSMEWSESYTNPSSTSSSNDAPDSKSADSKTIRLGLGLGLGLGIGLIILLIIGFFCWRRHKKQKEKHSRDSAIQALQQDAQHFRPSLDDEMMERDYPWTGGWYTGGNDPYPSGNQYENLRGDRGNISMGTSAMGRKSGAPRGVVMRGGYAPAGGNNTGMGMILEDEEDEYRYREGLQTPGSELPEDPFATPMGNTTVVTGGAAAAAAAVAAAGVAEGKQRRRYDPDVQDWVSEADVAESLLTRMNSSRRGGRVSPTRRNSGRSSHLRDDDSRNGSNLSDSSTKLSPAGRRTPFSGTSGLMAGSTTLAGSDAPKPGSSSSGSYTTAKSGFNNLQAEGPSLLMGQNTGYNHDDDDEEEEFPSSPSKSKPRRNWLGSLRRVFSTSGNTSPESSPHREPDSPMEYMHHLPGGSDYEVRTGLSGELLRRKQGRHDWDLAHQGGTRANDDGASEKDWDIEKAVENRLVQVMFSVPKERLRVVNPDDEDGGDGESIKQPQMAKLVNPGDSERSESLRTEGSDGRKGEEGGDIGMLRVAEDTSVRGDSFETGRGLSALSMVSSEGRSDAQIEVAEAVRVQRPRKTRVLRMAESFEERGREGSASPSPTRGMFF